MNTLWWRPFDVFSPHIFIYNKKNTSKRNRFSNTLNMQFQKLERTLEKKLHYVLKLTVRIFALSNQKKWCTSL